MSQLAEILERMTVAIEKLGEDPVIEMETAPPVCPHCNRMNPVISVAESGGTGPMAEFVIRCKCNSCDRIFYALPIQWIVTPEVRQIEQAVEQQKELTGHGNNGNNVN